MTAPRDGRLTWAWLGRAPYRRVLADQLALRERVWAGAPGQILLCEHPPVITLGRSADPASILVDRATLAAEGIDVVAIERGGDVTYHGPGQLMVYPVVRIRGVVEFLERIAGALAAACAAVGAPGAAFQRAPAGLWLDGAKVAACGIHVARGVSVHGFALDVATPPSAWARINPCGLSRAPRALAAALAARGQPARTVADLVVEVGPRLVDALS